MIFPVSMSFGKIFKTFDNNTISSCTFYLNVLPLNYEYICRKVNFLAKLKTAENSYFLTVNRKQLFLVSYMNVIQ